MDACLEVPWQTRGSTTAYPHRLYGLAQPHEKLWLAAPVKTSAQFPSATVLTQVLKKAEQNSGCLLEGSLPERACTFTARTALLDLSVSPHEMFYGPAMALAVSERIAALTAWGLGGELSCSKLKALEACRFVS